MNFRAVATLALALTLPAVAQQVPHSFAAVGDHFELDGKPFRILTGEMHYPRIPRARWDDAMQKAKALGLNAITTYVFWNVHEPRPGVYDFTGQNDLGEYLSAAHRAGLKVILRPGPYACAEWEFGGYPAWLVKDPTVVVRSTDPKFMQPVAKWFRRLGQEVQPYLAANGGPIIAVQVENEYGSFGSDHAYMEQMKDLVISSGIGGKNPKKAVDEDGKSLPQDTGTMLYTADGGVQLPNGTLPELPAVVNFGGGQAKSELARYEAFRPNGPRMVGEYWAGWFDHWGNNHQKTNAAEQVAEYEYMLKRGYSVSLYMLYGGTSFGWMAGANSGAKAPYEPDVTSYDYDAPIDERGNPTPKYFALREVIQRITGVTPPPVPETPATATYPIAPILQSASLWDNLSKPHTSATTLTMEDIDQAYGYILYTTQLSSTQQGELKLDELHDYAQIYLDHKLVGTLDRRHQQSALTLPAGTGARELEILVENSSRINYSLALRGERKGITHRALLNGTELNNWKIYPLPFDHPEALHFTNDPCSGPCFFRTSVSAPASTSIPADTFLETTGIHKGFAWINAIALGRAWNIGPQAALFLPGSWLHSGENQLIVFDLTAEGTPHLVTRTDTLYIPGADEGKHASSSTINHP
jgi:beta-galactosidase